MTIVSLSFKHNIIGRNPSNIKVKTKYGADLVENELSNHVVRHGYGYDAMGDVMEATVALGRLWYRLGVGGGQ